MRHYKLIERKNRTEFIETENETVAITIEECSAEAKCMVNVNDQENTTMYSFDCAISCESIEELQRCRRQLVSSFSDYIVPGFERGLIGEDRFDIYGIMVVGTGFYLHLTFDSVSKDQLSSMERMICEFICRHFPDSDTINGRILIHGESSTGLNDALKLAVLFHQTHGLDKMLFQFYIDDDRKGIHDIDIWLFPTGK